MKKKKFAYYITFSDNNEYITSLTTSDKPIEKWSHKEMNKVCHDVAYKNGNILCTIVNIQELDYEACILAGDIKE